MHLATNEKSYWRGIKFVHYSKKLECVYIKNHNAFLPGSYILFDNFLHIMFPDSLATNIWNTKLKV